MGDEHVKSIETEESLISHLEKAEALRVDTESSVKGDVEANDGGHGAKKKRQTRRKEDQFIASVMKSLSGVQDPEEKIRVLAQRMFQMEEESKKIQTAGKEREKRISQLQRENEQSSADLSKAILTRTRLEALCRELQRQHKVLKEEMSLRSREDEEKRKEVAGGFQAKLTEISALIEENNTRNGKLKEQNSEIRDRLNEVVDRYAAREEEVKGLLKTAELQTSLAEAKIAKAEEEMSQCRRLYIKEKETWTRLEAEYKAQLNLLEQNEQKLKAEVSIYSGKYQGFQDAFKNFQSEMNNMTKKISHLEKETTAWRQRYERTAATLITLAKDKELVDAKLEAARKAASRLETISRALLEDRNEIRKVLQASNNETTLLQDEWTAFVERSTKRLKECELNIQPPAPPCVEKGVSEVKNVASPAVRKSPSPSASRKMNGAAESASSNDVEPVRCVAAEESAAEDGETVEDTAELVKAES